MPDLNTFAVEACRAIKLHLGSDRDTAMELRELLRRALSSESFLLSCVDRIVASMEETDGAWRNPPLYVAQDPGFLIRAFYWPPGFRNEPHCHTSWSVTGVLQNEIVVETFADSDTANQSPPSPLKSVAASTGQVGYLLPPCIHCLHNPAVSDSATLHLFGPEKSDHPTLAPQAAAQASPKRVAMTQRRVLSLMCDVLERISNPQMADLLQRVFALGDPHIKLKVVKALVPRDLNQAYDRMQELEACVDAGSREMLMRVAGQISAVLRRRDGSPENSSRALS